MSKINNEDMNEKKAENTKLSAEEMEQVTGGAAYIKFDGVDGESQISPKTIDAKQIDILSVDVKRLGR